MVSSTLNVLKLFFTACLLTAFLTSRSQTCEWLRAGLYNTQNSSSRSNSINTDKDNNAIVVGYFFYDVVIESDTFYAVGGSKNCFMAKYNDTGKLLWALQATGDGHFNDVITDDDGNIYVVGGTSGNTNFGNGVSINNTPTSAFLVKYNPNGQALWVRQFTGNTSVLIYSSGVTLAIDKNQNIIVGLSFVGNFSILGSTISYTSNSISRYDLCVAKFKSDGTLKTAAKFGGTADDKFVDIDCDGQGNVYLLAYTTGGLTFGSQNFSGKGMLILKMDSLLAPINGTHTTFTSNSSVPSGIVVRENGFFAVTGSFSGTVDFGGITMSHSGTLYSCFVNYYKPSLDILWARKSTPLSSSAVFTATVGMSRYSDYLYFGGTVRNGNIQFGSLTLIDPFPTSTSAAVVKLDTLGNFLWGFCNGLAQNYSNIFKSAVDRSGNAYITGEWQDRITVFNKTITASNTQHFNFFAAKITDYSISRGPVSSGPYCSGDTILIPYTRAGAYSSSNEFIAQLSDSAGNFYGDERELGRITSRESDTIKGLLPLFNVATNNKYRIRIISTMPQVQSFYRLDLLRLLIYSKDSANAGPDQTVCEGKSIRLSTTGGSRWNWSPSTYMLKLSDTANRQPLIKPDSTIEYRIIISDSSGCGDTDTDYVKIFVKPQLTVSLPDTVTFCKGRAATLQAQPAGGDSLKYTYRWVYADTLTKVIDSLPQITVSPTKATGYLVIMDDGCSVKTDSAYVKVIPDSTLLMPVLKDTTICLGNAVTIDAAAVACDVGALKYTWDNGLGEGAVKTITPSSTTSYTITATDSINGRSDKRTFKIIVLPALKLSITPDTTICTGENVSLTSTANGGNIPGHTVTWTEIGTQWTSTGAQVNVSPNTTTVYKAVLTDGCTATGDSAKVTVTVRAPLKVIVNTDTTICVGQSASLKAAPSGGYAPNYKIVWVEVGGTFSATNAQATVSPVTTTIYRAVLSDGCSTPSDSDQIIVTVRAPLKVTVNADTTICVGQLASLRTIANGGYSPNYKIIWKEVAGTWSDNNAQSTVGPVATTVYRAVLTDNCSTPSDSSQITVTVRAPLSIKATPSRDSICSNQILLLTAAISGGNTPGHSVLWSAEGSLWTSVQNPVTDTPKNTTKYIVRLSDNCSPAAYDTLTVVVLPVPRAVFDIIPASGCPPLEVTFTDKSTGNDTSKNMWNAESDEGTGITEFQHTFLKAGSYGVTLTVANSLGCIDTRTIFPAVTVFEKPTAGFVIKPEIREIDKELQLFNYSAKANKYVWDMGDGNALYFIQRKDTIYSYKDTGYFSVFLIAENEKGCKDTSTQLIHVFDMMHCIIPNAFTPNGDFLNDVFAPVCTGTAVYTLSIYNRWGQLLQECDNCVWDGTYYGNPVTDGAYTYMLRIEAPSKKKETVFGVVNLLR